MEILNAFQIPYLVIHDEDPVDPELRVGGKCHNAEKLHEAEKTFNENKKIEDAVDPKKGQRIMIPGKFEDLLGISKSQIDKVGKPLAAAEKCSQMGIVSGGLAQLVKEAYA
jgi:hypothetical protein